MTATGGKGKQIANVGVKNDLRGLVQGLKSEAKGAKISRETARSYLIARGVEPLEWMVKVFEHSINAFEMHRGAAEGYDPGPQYLAVAARMAEAMAKFSYPTMKAVAVKFADIEEENASSTISAKKISPEKVREVILADPFASKMFDDENGEKAMEEMHNAAVAAIAKGDMDILESKVLPVGPEQKAEIIEKVKKK